MRGGCLRLLFLAAFILQVSFCLHKEEDGCDVHLSCETCILDDDCLWCSSNLCIKKEEQDQLCSGFDITNNCRCNIFKNCKDCVDRDYCGWCQDTKTCHPLGARPEECVYFDDELCVPLDNSAAFEKSVVAISISALILIIAVYIISLVYRIICRRCKKKKNMSDMSINSTFSWES